MPEVKLHAVNQKLRRLAPNHKEDSKYPEWNPVIEKFPIDEITIEDNNGVIVPFNFFDDALLLVTAILPVDDVPKVIGIERDCEDKDWLPVLAKYVEGCILFGDDDDEEKEYNQYIFDCIDKCLELSTTLANEKKEKKKTAGQRKKERKEAKKSALRAVVEAKRSGASDKELNDLHAQKLGEYDVLLRSHGINDHDRKEWLHGLRKSIRIRCKKSEV